MTFSAESIFCAISAHFGSSLPASAGHEGTASAGRCRRRPHPPKTQGKPMISRCCARGRPCPRGLGRSPHPQAAVDFLSKICNFLHISADFVYFLAEILSNSARFWLIFGSRNGLRRPPESIFGAAGAKRVSRWRRPMWLIHSQ